MSCEILQKKKEYSVFTLKQSFFFQTLSNEAKNKHTIDYGFLFSIFLSILNDKRVILTNQCKHEKQT